MRNRPITRILGCVPADSFVGRQTEIMQLMNSAQGTVPLVVLAAPGCGSTELLRQVFDRIFVEQNAVIPFYYEVRASDVNARTAAIRFLNEFLLQTVAFRHRNPNVIIAPPDISEIAELATADDSYWINRLIETRSSNRVLDDDRSFVRHCLSAPLRAAANGAKSIVLIDGADIAHSLDGGSSFFEDLKEAASRSVVPFVISGRRRALFGATKFASMDLGPLSLQDAGGMAAQIASRNETTLNDETRDLAAIQLGGNPIYLSSVFATASHGELTNFESFQRVYTDEIFGGHIGRHLDSVLSRAVAGAAEQYRLLGLIFETMTSRGTGTPVSYWRKLSGLTDAEFDSALNELHHSEIINVSSGSVAVDAANVVVCDYVRARVALEIDCEARALAVGEALTENIRRASTLLAEYYRKSAAIGVRELILAFAGQPVSRLLIDYGRFKEEVKGANDEKTLTAIKEDNDRIELPRIVYSAYTAAIYPALRELCDAERSAIGLGFADMAGRTETAVIAVEIDSKLEAKRELTEFWCDRLEMAAAHCDLEDYRLWLITPEGFTPEALDVLRERNAYGSSRKQVELLKSFLNVDVSSSVDANADDFEIVVPMGEDSEIIAARTIEDIAKRHHFSQKAINQIKTAVVEACINATEHSLSPDKKIYQRFSVDDEKLTISIWNRGLRLADKQPAATASDDARRGWGLKLIQGLMDDVKLEHTDDGTRITMAKFLNKA